MRYMVTRVVTAHTATADQKGDQPRYTMGRYTHRMHPKVNTSPAAPLMPCLPPTRHSTSRYSAAKARIWNSRFASRKLPVGDESS